MGFGKDGKGQILRETVVITPGALGAAAVVEHTGGITLQTTSFRILKAEFFISQSGAFAAEGDEVIIGFANGELTAAEIAECINVDGPPDRNSRVDEERAMRAVWLLADLKEPTDGTTGYALPLNNGLPMEFTPRWTFTPTEGWDWFAFNPLAGALTTGSSFRITAKYFGVWVD